MRSINGNAIDVQNILSKTPFTTTGIKGELHLPGHSFTGPGTNLNLRLNENNEPYEWSKPINRVDAAAQKHDLAYRSNPDNLEAKHLADKEMIAELDSIPNPTIRERLERALVKKLLQAKVYFGLGVDEKNKSIQLALELHRQFKRSPDYLSVKVFNKDEIWSADLVEMPHENQGRSGTYKYILTVIDLYTRYAWAIPLKDKTSNTVTHAFQSLRKLPKKLWTDKGKEFYNKVFQSFLKHNNVMLYSTFNEGKAVVVERFNRTLKDMMWKKFTVQDNQKWVQLLPELVDKYNNSYHSGIRLTPKEAYENPEKIQNINYRHKNVYNKKSKFKVGDKVRIFKWKSIFEKGFTAKWTNEIFIIKQVLESNNEPTVYEIEDENGEVIEGRFYKNELQKTNFESIKFQHFFIKQFLSI